MKIGLTGSIACGKSTVSAYRARSCAVVDADGISRALTAPGGAALPALREAFGASVFDGDALNRRALGSLVFADAGKRAQLDAILHPMILAKIAAQLDAQEHAQDHAQGEAIVVGDVPLLYECGMEAQFDRIWVVSAPREVQLDRLRARDGLPREEAERRIDAQMPLEEKIRRADAVIDTNGSLAHTQRQVDALLRALDGRRQP